jgi:hypothetical protein
MKCNRKLRTVVTENSVRFENAGVPISREIMVATTMRSLFVALFASVASSFRTRAALQAEILALRHQLAVFQKALAPSPLRPAVVGSVVPILVRLAAMSADGSARHGPRLAAQSFRLASDQEVAAASGKARSCGEPSRPDSAHAPSQSPVGCTSHSRRTAQVGDCGGAIHGGEILASAPQTAFPDLANLPDESSSADRGHRFFHRADGDLPGPIRLRRAVA